MKELSVEDKAERYNEAIKVAKSKIKNDKNHVLYEDDVIEIFPELKENEDERIKKDIIATLHLYFGEPLDDEEKEMIAWVKKQEQTFTKKDIDDAYLKGVCDAKKKNKVMKAEELMIGDYVHVKPSGMLMRVAAVHRKKVAYHSCANKLVWVRKDLLEPIPLTPEILKKNGFKTEDDVHFSIHGQSNTLELLLVEVPFDGYYFDIVRTEKTMNKCNQRCYIDRYFASSNYVHQLQHALRLCGIEKKLSYETI